MPAEALGPIARRFRQCGHCRKPEALTEGGHLQCCKACHNGYYCNKECQTNDWPNHKADCRDTRNARQYIKELASKADTGPNPRNVETVLKHWLQIHRPTLDFAFVQALNLFSHPERINTHILHVKLKPIFAGKVPRIADEAKMFHLEAAEVIAVQEFAALPGYHTMLRRFESLRPKSRELQQQGGTGLGMILIAAGSVTHTSPFGIPFDITKHKWQYVSGWKKILADNLVDGARL